METLLPELSRLIKQRNLIDQNIASIVNRPALIGHIGEYIAADIFGIKLEESASHRGSDGRFRHGMLAGCSVNIKWYRKRENILDLNVKDPPDYYLVMTGPKTSANSSLGTTRPLYIESAFLFKTCELFENLKQRCVKIGTASSVIDHLWDKAELYPRQNNAEMILTDEQQKQLALFAPS